MKIHEWFIEKSFNDRTVNYSGEHFSIYISDYKELIPILPEKSFYEFAENKAGSPFNVYFYTDSKYIVSASTLKGSYVMHFDLNGDRVWT